MVPQNYTQTTPRLPSNYTQTAAHSKLKLLVLAFHEKSQSVKQKGLHQPVDIMCPAGVRCNPMEEPKRLICTVRNNHLLIWMKDPSLRNVMLRVIVCAEYFVCMSSDEKKHIGEYYCTTV